MENKLYLVNSEVVLPQRTIGKDEMISVVKNLSDSEICKSLYGDEFQYFDKIGFLSKKILSGDEGIISLAQVAAEKVLKGTNINAEEIDIIICCYSYDKHYFGAMISSVIANEIGATNAICRDITGSCCGTLMNIEIIEALTKSNKCKNAIIVGMDALSTLTTADNIKKYKSIVTWGDDAGAFLFSTEKKSYKNKLFVLYDKTIVVQDTRFCNLITLNLCEQSRQILELEHKNLKLFRIGEFKIADQSVLYNITNSLLIKKLPISIAVSNTGTLRIDFLSSEKWKSVRVVKSYQTLGHMGCADIIANLNNCISRLNMVSKEAYIIALSFGLGYTLAGSRFIIKEGV
ncbi:MAG: hypothetical protein LBM93_04660 [Oscillospiraceae bacterium]|nr:hypothetical protein [Oscillospiraceae bacterium]